MSDVLLNFSSQWPSIQVARVIPHNTPGWESDSLYGRRYKHGLGYPPLALEVNSGAGEMNPRHVDDEYVYTGSGGVIVYPINIAEPFLYPSTESSFGDVVDDTSGGSIDLRQFLLHSRAVSPMVLSIETKTLTAQDDTLQVAHNLDYPTFSFGYLRINRTVGGFRSGVWYGVPLAGQSWPVMFTDGYTSRLNTTGSPIIANRASIITLRNPAIISKNTVGVTI